MSGAGDGQELGDALDRSLLGRTVAGRCVTGSSAGNPAVLDVVAEAVHGFIAYPITVAKQELARGSAYIAAAVADGDRETSAP